MCSTTGRHGGVEVAQGRLGDLQRRLILGAIFFLSGGAALIYQVGWQRLLSVYYGVGAVSSSLIVCTFMFGLGIGGLLGGRVVRSGKSMLTAYVLIELGIGLFGIISLPLLLELGQRTAGQSYLFTAVYVTLFLIVPTVLMGMTLPIIVSILQRYNSNVTSNISYYYFINTLGAAVGAVVCSYLLISFFGIGGAIATAVAVNLLLAVSLLLISRSPEAEPSSVQAPDTSAALEPASEPRSARWQYIALALLFINGAIAIGYQIVWYRVVGALLKDSSYVFSTTLSVYLLGIAIGSYVVYRWVKATEYNLVFRNYVVLNALVSVFAVLSFIALYIVVDVPALSGVIAAYHRFETLPLLGDPGTVRGLAILAVSVLMTLVWPIVLIIASAVCMGAAFPLGVSLVGSDKAPDTSAVGLGYASTIAGNTVGGALTSFILLPAFKSVGVVLIFLLLQVAFLFLLSRGALGPRTNALRIGAIAAVAVLALIAPGSAAFYERLHPEHPGSQVHFIEGVEGVVLTFEKGQNVRTYINGSSHGGRPGPLFSFNTLEALSYAPTPKEVLLIGYGTGQTLDGLLLDERIERVTVVELNRLVIENSRRVGELRAGLNDPRVRFIFDDGRRFLERDPALYDVILMDPLRSRSAYSNNIYSLEFFTLIKQRLRDDGTLLVRNDDKTGVLAKTVATEFDFVQSYKNFLVASPTPRQVSRDIYTSLFAKLPPSLSALVGALESKPLCGRGEVLSEAAGLPVTRDLNPRLEYYVGTLAFHQAEERACWRSK